MTTPAATRAFIDSRARAREADAQSRAQAILGRLPAAVAAARARFGPLDFWLFGSMTGHGAPIHAASDVDIAVRGLPPSCYFELAAHLADMLEADVDLVALEQAPQSLRDRLRHDGIPL